MKTQRLAVVFGVCFAIAAFGADAIPENANLEDLTKPVSEGGIVTPDSTPGNNGAAAAFDNDKSTGGGRWLVGKESQPCHVTYDFGAPTAINALRIYNGNTDYSPAGRAVKTFTVSGSDDNAIWTVVYESGEETGWTKAEARFFAFPATKSFRYWKFDALAPVSAGEYIQIHELEYFNIALIPSLAEANVIKTGTGFVSVTGTLSGQLDGTVTLVLATGENTYEYEIGTFAAGETFSKEISLDGIPLDVWYTAVLTISKDDGSSIFPVKGSFYFGEQKLPVTSYGGGEKVGMSQALPLADGNIIMVDSEGVTFNAPNTVMALHASIQADGKVVFTASNIGVVELTGSNRFSGGLHANGLSALSVASQEVLGGPDSAFLAYPHLSIIGGFMTGFGDHPLTRSGSALFDLQQPDSVFTIDFDIAVMPNDSNGAGLHKYGPGKLTLASAQTYHNVQPTYGTFLNGGELEVDGARGGSLYGKLGGSVAIAGGVLDMKANPEGTTAFGVANVNIGSINSQQNYYHAGGGVIRLDANGGSGVTMGLSNLTYSANSKGPRGRYLGLETIGNAAFHTTSTNDISGVLRDHRVILNGTDWASADENGWIRPFANYALQFPSEDAPAENLFLSGAHAVPESQTVSSLKLAGNSSVEISDGQTLTLADGAILKTGDGDAVLSGGSILSEAGKEAGWTDLLVVAEGTGTLTIDSAIADHPDYGGCWLTKAGKGTLRLGAGTVAFTKGIYVLDGALEISKEQHVGASFIGLFGGTLKVTENVSASKTILTSGNGAVFDIAAGKSFTMRSSSMNGYPIGGTTNGSGLGGLHVCNSDGGDGMLVAGTIKSTSGIFIDCGVFRMGTDGSLHSSGVNPLYFGTGPVMKLQLYKKSGTIAGIYGGTESAVIENGATDGISTLTIATGGSCTYPGIIQDGATKALNLVKYGCGRQTLSGTCTYTGSTLVANGTLAIDGQHTGTGEFSVIYPGVLAGNGVIAGSVSLVGGGTISAGNETASDSLTIGALACDGDSVIEVAFDGDGPSRIHVTGTASVAGTVRLRIPDEMKNTPCNRVILHADEGISATALTLEAPDSKLAWSLAVHEKDIYLRAVYKATKLLVF